MNKLTKSMLTERDDVCARLRAAFESLEQAVDTYNEAMRKQWEAVHATMNAYNDVAVEATTWQENVASDIQDYIDSRSDKWQESERGQAYLAWQGEYESSDLEDITIDQPDSLELSTGDQAETLEALAEEIS